MRRIHGFTIKEINKDVFSAINFKFVTLEETEALVLAEYLHPKEHGSQVLLAETVEEDLTQALKGDMTCLLMPVCRCEEEAEFLALCPQMCCASIEAVCLKHALGQKNLLGIEEFSERIGQEARWIEKEEIEKARAKELEIKEESEKAEIKFMKECDSLKEALKDPVLRDYLLREGNCEIPSHAVAYIVMNLIASGDILEYQEGAQPFLYHYKETFQEAIKHMKESVVQYEGSTHSLILETFQDLLEKSY